MPDPLPRAEDASLYLLDLLDPEARRAFEADLESSSDLRRHVADLETTLDALAEAAPPVNPPPRAWAAIAERVAHTPKPVAGFSTTAWALLRAWLTNGWAVATLVAVAFVVHLLVDPSTGVPGHQASIAGLDAGSVPEATPGRRSGASPAPDGGAVPRGRFQGAGTSASTGGRLGTGQAAKSVADEARLQDRVRGLSEQVALLTRILTQQSVVPAGASRLQVFRLVSTNTAGDGVEGIPSDSRRFVVAPPASGSPGTVEQPVTPAPPAASGGGALVDAGNAPGLTAGEGAGSDVAASQDISLTLALSAARQLAGTSVTPPSGGGGTADRSAVVSDIAGLAVARPEADVTAGLVPLPVDVPVVRDPIRVIDLMASGTEAGGAEMTLPKSDPGVISGADGTAFGAYSPDTGHGAVAFRVPAETAEPGVLQLWLTDAQTGLVQSLGYASVDGATPAPQVMVMRFSVDGGSFTTPTFMITREPLGGSLVPTGPVVAQPPPVTSNPVP